MEHPFGLPPREQRSRRTGEIAGILAREESLADRVDRLTLVFIGLSVAAIVQFLFPSLPRDLAHGSLFGEPITFSPWLLGAMAVVGLAEAVAQHAHHLFNVPFTRIGN